MRAVLVGLVGAVLLSGAAQAGACRPGHMSFVKGSKVFRVSSVSQADGKVGDFRAQQTVFLGRIGSAPYVIDIRGVQGSNPTFDSYRGAAAKSGAFKLKRLATVQDWAPGSQMTVDAGSLEGDWRTVCK